ncbi:MAG: hypothetical protein HY028_02065 [Gammaproteobacteria bacterium]|nr:hypothetical protein [Gammaproteobacteria bacterium]
MKLNYYPDTSSVRLMKRFIAGASKEGPWYWKYQGTDKYSVGSGCVEFFQGKGPETERSSLSNTD